MDRKPSFSAGSGLPVDGVNASAAANASDKNPCSLESACFRASASSSQQHRDADYGTYAIFAAELEDDSPDRQLA